MAGKLLNDRLTNLGFHGGGHLLTHLRFHSRLHAGAYLLPDSGFHLRADRGVQLSIDQGLYRIRRHLLLNSSLDLCLDCFRLHLLFHLSADGRLVRIAYSRLNLSPRSSFDGGANLLQHSGFHLCPDLLSRAVLDLLPNDLGYAFFHLLSHLFLHGAFNLCAHLFACALLYFLPDNLRHGGFDLRLNLFPRGLGNGLYDLLMRAFPHLTGDFRINRFPNLLSQYSICLLVNIVLDICEQLALQAGKLLIIVVNRQLTQFDMQLGKIAAFFLQTVIGRVDDRFKDLPCAVNESAAIVVDL